MLTTIPSSDFKLEIKRGLSGGYLFYGPENYLAAHWCREARKLIAPDGIDADFSCRRIDASLCEDPIGELYDALSTLSGFGGRRLTEVTGLDIDHLKAADFERLTDCCSLADETAILILRAPPDLLDVGYLPKRPSQKFAALCEVLRPVSFEYETPARLSKWITAHFAAKTVACEPEISQMLIQRCGRDMSTLAGETDKLSAYVLSQNRRKVTAEDVDLVCVVNSEYGAFDFSNAICDGDTQKALLLLGDMKSRKEKPEIILATISRVICDMLIVSTLAEKGANKAEIAKQTKLHEFKVGMYLNRLRRLPQDYAKTALDRCLECDRLMKSTALDSYALIERLICSI